MNDYLRVKEVSKLLAVSEQTVRKLTKAGSLRSVRIGKRGVRISRVSVEEYINLNGTCNPTRTEEVIQ